MCWQPSPHTHTYRPRSLGVGGPRTYICMSSPVIQGKPLCHCLVSVTCWDVIFLCSLRQPLVILREMGMGVPGPYLSIGFWKSPSPLLRIISKIEIFGPLASSVHTLDQLLPSPVLRHLLVLPQKPMERRLSSCLYLSSGRNRSSECRWVE